MNRTSKILIAALAVQVGLVAVTWSMRGQAPSMDAEPLLPGVALGDITGFTLVAKAGDKEKTLELAKKDGKWVMPGADDYPADEKKVEEVLKKVAEAKIRAPIANNKANHNALDVGDREFSRRLTLKTGAATHTLIVGSAKGSSAHARFADKDEVFLARGFSAWELRDTVTHYVDEKYLDIEAPDAVKVTNAKGTVSLNKVEGNWKVAELPEGTPLDTAVVEAFINNTRTVRLVEPVGKTVKPEYGLGGADGAKIEIKKGDEVTRYEVGVVQGESNRYLKAEKNDWVVTAAGFAVGALIDQTPDKFIKKEEPKGEAPGGMPDMPFDPGALPPMPFQ